MKNKEEEIFEMIFGLVSLVTVAAVGIPVLGTLVIILWKLFIYEIKNL